jgi:hypothetical protein
VQAGALADLYREAQAFGLAVRSGVLTRTGVLDSLSVVGCIG